MRSARGIVVPPGYGHWCSVLQLCLVVIGRKQLTVCCAIRYDAFALARDYACPFAIHAKNFSKKVLMCIVAGF